jgi:hypothetical protein
MAGVVSPLGLPSTTKFDALPPGSNNEAVLLPDTNGSGPGECDLHEAKCELMTGSEKYINSGWFLPNGLEKEYPGSGNTFTVKFEKQGTYDYLCILHPWMTGRVVVT